MSFNAYSAMQIGGQALDDEFSDPNLVELIEAAMVGKIEKVAGLVAQGVNVNAIGDKGTTPLLWVQHANNLAGMEALLKAGANPNQKTVGGVSPLVWAAGGDNPEQLSLLLSHGGNPNSNDTGKIEDRPLSRAAAQGRLSNVKILVSAGADVNAHDSYELNAAALAFMVTGNFEITAYLLDNGYDYNLQHLARAVEIRQVTETDKKYWKNIVIEMLKKRGVTFPVYTPCYPPGDERRIEGNCK
ncbi:ankyrin repeat domain-containing protein [Pseudomonas schmalbachii]|uniref:Ankyrin repeat domain-containing protein n=1 Tax=Pseudomonas schmalbachii TaxID=2816993 RepID=A0ABS3TJK7_9PSED|nr:ankyrin repeat domain-containing protein [Pseudomonas schmalbachii]MBO3273849.1 ankyrin repeat domain-containing protein [Pseudomonas schmalbachii]